MSLSPLSSASRPAPSFNANNVSSPVQAPVIESKGVGEVQPQGIEGKKLLADRFETGGVDKAGEGGVKQAILQKLEEVTKALGQLVELLGGQKQGEAGAAGGADAAPKCGTPSPGGADAAPAAAAPAAPAQAAPAADASASDPKSVIEKLTSALKDVLDLLSSGDAQKIAQAGEALDKLTSELNEKMPKSEEPQQLQVDPSVPSL